MAANFNSLSRQPIVDEIFIKLINTICVFDKNTGPWIAGGCARKLWQGIPWITGDIDIFFSSVQQYHTTLTALQNTYNIGYAVHNYRLAGLDFDLDIDCVNRPVAIKKLSTVKFETDNAITLDILNHDIQPDTTFNVQLIKRKYFKSPIELINDFDLTVCQFFSDGRDVYATVDAMHDIDRNIINPIKDNVKLMRYIKYMAHGFDLDNNLADKIFDNISNGIYRDEINDDY